MGFNLQEERVDADAKVTGVWRANARWAGCRFKIASSSVGTVKRELAKVIAETQDSGVQLSDDEIAEKMADFVSANLLLDWEGDIADGDKKLKYSKDNARRLLYEVEDFRNWVMQQADNIANYKAAKLGEVEGNSEPA